MRTKLIAILVANLFAGGSAWGADDSFNWSGSMSLGGRWSDTDGVERNGAFATSATTSTPFTGPKDGAKAEEYRDLTSGAIGTIDILGGNRSYWFRAFGENFGYDDQYINIRGGGYGVFKGQFIWNKIPHNLSWNALSPLANPTSTLQVGPAGAYPQAQNPATWNSFNYGLQRDTMGGNLEFTNNSPWFIRADYNEVEMTGVRPQSGVLGTGSGNGFIELGFPVDYKTKNATIEAGYAAKTWNVTLGFLDSKFSNGIDSLQWTNFYLTSALDRSALPRDNDLTKWSLNASVRQLPLDSTLVARITQSKLTSGFDLTGPSAPVYFSGGLKPTTSASPPIGAGILVTTPSSPAFNGEHKTTSASVSLTSTLMPRLDSRIYYSYYDKDNNSTPIGYAAGGLGPDAANCPNPGTGIQSSTANRFCITALEALEAFAYTKNEAGVDLNYRIGAGQKLMGGYNYLMVERTLVPADETRDQKFWIEYKNSVLADLSGRAKYQYMQRRSDIDHSSTNNASGQTPAQVAYYYSAYDIADNDQNKVKASVDWNPAAGVNVSAGATWLWTDYKDLFYGRTDDQRADYDLSISFGDPGKFVITAIGNWGEVKFNQAYHQGTGPTPGGTQTATNFDWGTENTQSNWLLALQADWPVNDRLALTGSVSYQDTGGGVDFWSGNTAGAGGYLGGPLVNYVTDNTRTTRVSVKAEYKINKNWSATAGYAYEKYDYDDDQMRGYQSYYGYYQNLGGTNNIWMTGAFANPAYQVNVFYVYGTYKFN